MTIIWIYLYDHHFGPQLSKAWTTVFTFNYFKLGYFWPTPTYNIGLDVEYTNDKAVPTLSSTVSNFDNKIASIWGVKSALDSSFNALLNFVIWSTAAFPTSASPMNTTRLGLFNLTRLASSFIKGWLSCILPAVSTKTQSILFLVA